MRWDVADNIRCTIYAFSGINLSGKRTRVRIFPSGVDGELADGSFQSMIIVAAVGTRVTLFAASSPDNAYDMTWRAIEVRKGKHYALEDGKPAVNVPDLDLYEDYDAERTDPDFEQTYAKVAGPEHRPDWTYGTWGRVKLKNNVHAIKIDRIE